jgi:hypothetical protein
MAVDLDDLWDELHRGKVYECSLRGFKVSGFRFVQVDGLSAGESIYIDPRPAILETLCHELLHRRKPRWSERAVSIAARNFVVQMDDATKAKWWRAYQKVKRKGVPVEPHDEDE